MQVTNDNTVIATNASLGIEVIETEIRNSSALVINALTGSNKTGESLKHERISEDLLLAATVHAQLIKIDKSLADRLVARIKPNYDKQLKQRNRQPMFKAVSEILDVATRNNKKKGKVAKITKQQKKNILNFAFNKSQLDQKTSGLSPKIEDMSTSAKGDSNVGKIINRVESNNGDAKKSIKKFKRKINSKPQLSRRQVKKLRNRFNEIDPKRTPEAGPPSVTEEKKPEVKTEAPTHDDFVPTPDSLTIYPQKKGSPYFEIVLPEYRSEEVVDMGIFESNASNEALADLKFSHIDELGRAHWTADKPGSEYKNASVIKFKFIDGTYDLRYFDPEEFYNESYSY